MMSAKSPLTPHNIHDLNAIELTAVLNSWGEPPYRSQQIWDGLYKQYVSSAQEISNIPKPLRARLSDEFLFSGLENIHQQLSQDKKTIKTLFQLPGGELIEAVLMQYHQRNTLCISSQAGCAMNCSFCATGQMGYQRNLTPGEITEQVLFYTRFLKSLDEKVTNIVLMGMGEPFHNYDSVIKAISTLNGPDGMNVGERRFTISTVGIIPGIKRFTLEDRQINLAISLHAVDNDLRTSMLPVNRKYPVEALLSVCRDYVERTRRRVSFEWALIKDVNDSVEQAKKLAKMISGMRCHVNLIPLNPTSGYLGQGTQRDRAYAFQQALTDSNIPATIRIRRGIDIQAGCGQLATQKSE